MSLFHENTSVEFALPKYRQVSHQHTRSEMLGRSEMLVFLRFSEFWLLRIKVKRGTDSTSMEKRNGFKFELKVLFSVERVCIAQAWLFTGWAH